MGIVTNYHIGNIHNRLKGRPQFLSDASIKTGTGPIMQELDKLREKYGVPCKLYHYTTKSGIDKYVIQDLWDGEMLAVPIKKLYDLMLKSDDESYNFEIAKKLIESAIEYDRHDSVLIYYN